MSDKPELFKSGVILLLMILSLVPWWNAGAQERPPAGEVTLTPAQVALKGSSGKFNEYRDLRDGVYGHIGLHYDAERSYLDFRANDIGYKDQKYELSGGKWGSYFYSLDSDETPHNFTLGTSLHR